MRIELPTADQVVEELADRVASRIVHGAPVAFDSSLDELVEYHRFLLGINEKPETEEQHFSYAEVEGPQWSPPHRHWIRQYRRLFERAVDKLPVDTQFIEALSYVPYRLIQPLGDLKLSNEIVRGILDLLPVLMHCYEAWFTRQSQLSASAEALAGSDTSSYAGALRSTVGAWEALLQSAPYLLGWRETQGLSESQLWKVYAESWPFLWSHLSNTAYCLAVAVWNEDRVSANLFREALVRWPLGVLDDFPDTYGFRLPHLLFPDLLRLSWDDAKRSALNLAFGHYECSPGAIFAEVLNQTRNDVLLVTSSLLLHWTTSKQRLRDVGADIVRRLLKQEIANDELRLRQEWSLSTATLQMMRLQLAGERFQDGSYGAELDNFLRIADGLTERQVVPGRVFTPSTINDREGLLTSDVAILASASIVGQETNIHPELKEWIDDPALLPGDDQSLRAILNEFERYESAIQHSADHIETALRIVAPNANADEQVKSFQRGIQHIRDTIVQVRQERLRSQSIDKTKLETRRRMFEETLLTPPAQAPFFEDVSIERIGLDKRVKMRKLRFLHIPKERLVEPTMGAPVVNELEAQSKDFRSFSGNQVFADLTRKRRLKRAASNGVESPAFWKQISQLVTDVGERPILLVSEEARMRLLSRIYKADPIEGLTVERRSISSGRNQYVTTVEGVDIFGGVTDTGFAWLLSRDIIEAIEFSPVQTAERYVEVTYVLEPGELEGTMEATLRQRVKWRDGPIFEIRCPDPPSKE